jgi:predicted amidohydrolase YtcJ
MKHLKLIFAAGVIALASGCSQDLADGSGSDAADLILVNGRVYTLDWDEPAADGSIMSGAPHDESGWHPDANAVATRGGEIVFVGNTRDAMEYQGEESRVIDLAGATVIPGLVDSHTHIFQLGAKLERIDLTDIATEAEAVSLAAELAKSVPEGEWIIGAGWDEGAWANRYPDKVLLSEAVPDHPVYMRGLHGFAGWVNQMALDELGITAATEAPIGGEIRLDDNGEPSGLFLNNGTDLIDDRLIPADDVLARQFLKGLNRMAEDGYVAVHEAGVKSHHMRVLEELEASGQLPLRVYAMLSLRDEDLIRKWIAKGPDRDADSMLVTRAVKAYYDGALGSRGARLLYDYSDMPGHRGISGDGYGFNEELNAAAMKAGFQIGIHAIGDAGNRESLNILEGVFRDDPSTAKNRHRIEHAQVMHPDDLPRLGQLGIIASMEPPHAMEDKTWAEERLGPERILGAYAWRSLRETGADLTFNSDNPGSDHNIFYGLHSAIARQDKNLEPEGGWYAHEAMVSDEAIRGYTNWSAYASFREDETGIIEKGRWADLTVMDIDPFVLADESPGDILNGRILMTIVNGDIVYEGNL